MMARRSFEVLLCLSLAGQVAAAAGASVAKGDGSNSWNAAAAAAYLDGRANWWVNWTKAQRDHDTACVSCHTALPYVLSRDSLSSTLHEDARPTAEETMLKNVRTRVRLWSEVQPYYLDAKSGPGKSKESRSTESVLNALILASEDRRTGHLSPLTRDAFNHAWELQMTSGRDAGAWDWQVFRLAPWEAVESRYAGATWMALAIGWAPDHYGKDRSVALHLEALCRYLRQEYAGQPLINKMGVLWASEFTHGLLTADQKRILISQIRSKQGEDGGWSLATLGTWTRSDKTEQNTQSDGLATALAALALRDSSRHDKEASASRQRGLGWLSAHQEPNDGSWRASSLNKQRDPGSDVGRFMSDAATGYAVLALQSK